MVFNPNRSFDRFGLNVVLWSLQHGTAMHLKPQADPFPQPISDSETKKKKAHSHPTQILNHKTVSDTKPYPTIILGFQKTVVTTLYINQICIFIVKLWFYINNFSIFVIKFAYFMQFKDIEGQRVLINHLTDIIDQGRVSHAQLFHGTTQAGSLAIAIAYAQYIN